MFDRYILTAGPSHVSVVVTEKRAPTDESVRLLKEFEAKAEKKLLSSIRLDGCPFDCVMHVMQDTHDLDTKVLVRYRIGGGEERTVRHEFKERMESVSDRRDRLVRELRDVLAQDIAAFVLGKAWSDLQRRMPLGRV